MSIDSNLLLFLESKFAEIAGFVESNLSCIKTRKYFFETNIYYLRAYLSFLSSSNEEVLVLSVEFKRGGQMIWLESDLSKSEGVVIFEGPSAEISCRESISSEDFHEWMGRFSLFADEMKEQIVRRMVNQGPEGMPTV